MSDFPKLFKVSEVAEKARVTPMTVYNHINKGALRTIKIGGSVRVPEDALREYLGDSRVLSENSDK